MAAEVTDAPAAEFVTVPGDRTSEVGHTLAAPVPRAPRPAVAATAPPLAPGAGENGSVDEVEAPDDKKDTP